MPDPSSSSDVRFSWGRLFLGFVAAEVAMIAGAVAWVAIYSHFIEPGQPMEAYRAYARRTAPWVSLLVGVPAFFLASRWASRGWARTVTSPGLGLFLLYFVFDLALLSLAPGNMPVPSWFLPVNFGLKGLAAWLGAHFAALAALRGNSAR
ncbi:MAG: hypothetical protein JSR82_07635 [Verrucomicrobia bacterium]|nr:hypothetical protein [Verrucomicrobiota bacterium]